MPHSQLLDLSPLGQLLVLGLLLASGPVLWVWLRRRGDAYATKLQALTVVALFLTFDLVLFGAFTRLTDSGLGCPDWPGCYGSASPWGAHAEIGMAQAAMPTGPVTHGKAWVEMVHRYLAGSVGVLTVLLAVAAWVQRWRGQAVTNSSPWLPTATMVWVCVQGAFGALTVTMKLFPAIVTLHLLGGYALLALLVWQSVDATMRLRGAGAVVALPGMLRWSIALALAVLVVQALSGAWVSTNYAVLACSGFPQCQGVWWPAVDFSQGFTLWRPLGRMPTGEPIRFEALTAIHMAHRMLAVVALGVLGGLVWRLRAVTALRQQWLGLVALLVLQVLSGLGNVVLGWPLVGAVLHTGGAGALVGVLVWMLSATRSVASCAARVDKPVSVLE